MSASAILTLELATAEKGIRMELYEKRMYNERASSVLWKIMEMSKRNQRYKS